MPDSLGEKSDQPLPARYSVPFFVVPDADGIVAPQRSRVIADQRALYEPVAFKDYSGHMFRATQIRVD